MNQRKSKMLRKLALVLATDERGPQVFGRTIRNPPGSARAIYQRLKKMNARGPIKC